MENIEGFKEFLSSLLGLGDLQEGDKFISERNPEVVYEYREKDIIELLNHQLNYNLSGTTLYSDKYFEIPVEIARSLPFRSRLNGEMEVESEGKIQGAEIKYSLSNISKEYFIISIKMLHEEIKSSEETSENFPLRRLLLKSRTFSAFKRYIRYQSLQKIEDNNIESDKNIIEFVIIYLRLKSLKIESKEFCSFQNFENLKNSFIFEYMYNTSAPLNEYQSFKSLYRLFENRRLPIKSEGDTHIFPYRQYKTNLIKYYRRALETDDTYVKFISFYHVLEYFYDEIYMKRLIEDLRENITHPDFSYQKDNEIIKIIQKVKNRISSNNELGQGNELQSLKFVLFEFIDIDDLINKIREQDDSGIKYYEENKVSFSGSNTPVISWRDEKGVYTNIAKRIYYIRNSLVHSKEGKNHPSFKPYRDEDELEKEIPLIKSIAEMVIIKSSEVI